MGRRRKAMAKNICSVCCVPFDRSTEKVLSNFQIKIGNLVKTGSWNGDKSEGKDKLQDFCGDLVETVLCLECGQNLDRVLERREEVVAVEEELRRLQTEVLKLLRRLQKIVGEYKRDVGRMEGIVEESKEKVKRLDEFYGEREEKEEFVEGARLKEAIKCRELILSVVQSLIIFKGQLTLNPNFNLEVNSSMPVLSSDQLEEAEVNAGGSTENPPEKDDGDFEASENMKCDLEESEEEEKVAKKRGGSITPRKTRVTRTLRPRLTRKRKRISYAESDSECDPDSPKSPTREITPLSSGSESDECAKGKDNVYEPAGASSASDLDSCSDKEEEQEEDSDIEEDDTGEEDYVPKKKRGRPFLTGGATEEKIRSLKSLLPSVDWEHLPNFKRLVLQSMLQFQQKVTATKCPSFDDLEPFKNHPLTYTPTSDILTLAGHQLIIQEQQRRLQCTLCKLALKNSPRNWYDHVLGHHLKLFQCPHCPQNLTKRVLFRRHVLAHRGWTSGVTDLAGAFERSLVTISQKINAKQLSNFKTGQPPPPGSQPFSQVDPMKKYPINYNSSAGTLLLEGVTLSVDTQAKTIQCTLCPLKFKRCRTVDAVRSVYNHVIGHHLNLIQCTLCQNTFPDRKSLWTHIQDHRRHDGNDRGAICDICGKPLNRNVNLERHKWLHKSKEEQQEAIKNGNRPFKTSWEIVRSRSSMEYQCSSCGKGGFIDRFTLQQHERIHKAPEFKCGSCGKEFRQRASYLYHVKYICYPGKDEGIERETLFRFQCDQCPKKYPTESKLKFHKQIRGRP